MAQTTAGIPNSKFEIQLSTDGSSWSHKAGSVVKITPSGGEQSSGSQNTADGAAPIVTAGGKLSPAQWEITGIYTKTSAEFWDYIRDRFEGTSKTVYARYAPEGGIGTVVGNEVFTAADDAGSAFPAVIKRCSVPEVDAAGGGPALCSALLEFPKELRALTTTA